MQPGLDGPDRYVKLSGHLAVAQALEVEQPDRRTLARRQGSDGAADPRAHFGGFGCLVRPGLLRRALAGGKRNLGSQLALPAPGHVQRYPAEPGTEPVG
jgi:hypothetical protein